MSLPQGDNGSIYFANAGRVQMDPFLEFLGLPGHINAGPGGSRPGQLPSAVSMAPLCCEMMCALGIIGIPAPVA